jgi:hypothetical protein
MHNAEATREELLARIAELERAKPSGGIKVSAKGAISVYGLGKWPVTLYLSQMEQFIERVPEIQAFIADNREKLAVKAEKA